MKLDTFRVEPGKHELVIAYRVDGAKLHELGIRNGRNVPHGLGQPANDAKK